MNEYYQKKYSGIFAAVGIHPHDAEYVTEEGLARIRELAKEKKVKAIGEAIRKTGIEEVYCRSQRDGTQPCPHYRPFKVQSIFF